MARIIEKPAIIEAAGSGGKIIREYFGRVNSNTQAVSIAHMVSPQGWSEPAQCPDFDEYTLVLKGKLHIKLENEELVISEGEAVVTQRQEWVKYSSPYEGGAEYIAICLPAFSPELVNRETT